MNSIRCWFKSIRCSVSRMLLHGMLNGYKWVYDHLMACQFGKLNINHISVTIRFFQNSIKELLKYDYKLSGLK